MPRSKGAAAALDFFVWGTGHAYLGIRKAAGLPWVIWTILFGLFVLISAALEASAAFYSCDIFGCTYDGAGSAAFHFLPFLLIGGLMVFDLMRRGVLAAPGALGAMVTQTTGAPSAASQPVAAAGMSCPSCGAPVTAADTFCPSCGANLQQAAPVAAAAPAAGGKVCNSCGTANPPGYNFCKRCGAKLN